MPPCAYEAPLLNAPPRFGVEIALSPLLPFRKDGEGGHPGAGGMFL
ncbi:hypothetical protein MMA231_03421 [Asticcacaulis sp. MM231]